MKSIPVTGFFLLIGALLTHAADTTRPTVTIDSPVAGARILTSPIAIKGTASDNVRVDRVEVFTRGDSIYSGASIPVTGTNRWTSDFVDLVPGTNMVWVRAFDTSGNVSSLVRRSFFYVVKTPLSLGVNGNGYISGIRDQALLEIGRTYSISAVPRTGHVFVCWTDGNGFMVGTNATHRFLMEEGLALTANFTTNIFTRVKGNYRGLLMDAWGMAPYSSGAISLDLTGKSLFSGKITIGKKDWPFFGQFFDNEDGTAYCDLEVARGTNTSLSMSLIISTDPAAPGLTGEIYGEDPVPGEEWPMWWSASITAQKTKFPARPPLAGRYNLVLPSISLDDSGPGGHGIGSAVLATNGAVTVSITLPDYGASVSFASSIGKDGTVPVYGSLYSGKGLIIGWLLFTNQTTSVISDYNLVWVKPAGSSSKYYSQGFIAPVRVFGCRYVAPKRGENYFRWAPGVIDLNGGNLSAPLRFDAKFAPALNRFTVADGMNSTLSFNPYTGRISGKIFLDPNLPAKSVYGVATSKTGGLLGPLPSVFGFFIGDTQTGYFTLGPQ